MVDFGLNSVCAVSSCSVILVNVHPLYTLLSVSACVFESKFLKKQQLCLFREVREAHVVGMLWVNRGVRG